MNLQHGLDFVKHSTVFGGPPFAYEDDRLAYSEKRLLRLACCGATSFPLYTETRREIRVISFRKATKHEQAIFFHNI
ncbi:MAG: BrnT family toxin [Betaproteobacteria bacterium]|nr:BrnT family toxin [Betaproteobacteria bacterium]